METEERTHRGDMRERSGKGKKGGRRERGEGALRGKLQSPHACSGS